VELKHHSTVMAERGAQAPLYRHGRTWSSSTTLPSWQNVELKHHSTVMAERAKFTYREYPKLWLPPY